jgi:hypothetical protein
VDSAYRRRPSDRVPRRTFTAEREFEQAETGDIAARLLHARNEALRDRVGDLHEHDWHGASSLHDRRQVARGTGQDQVRHQPDQLRRGSYARSSSLKRLVRPRGKYLGRRLDDPPKDRPTIFSGVRLAADGAIAGI